MDNEQQPDKNDDDDGEDRVVIDFAMPGLSIRITERTLQTIGKYTGKSWMAVVFAIAIAIIIYAASGLSKGAL